MKELNSEKEQLRLGLLAMEEAIKGSRLYTRFQSIPYAPLEALKITTSNSYATLYC